MNNAVVRLLCFNKLCLFTQTLTWVNKTPFLPISILKFKHYLKPPDLPPSPGVSPSSAMAHASLIGTCMSMVWLYTGVLSCLVSPGTWTLHPTPYRGLIWGERRCVLLLVTNNHSRPITFTACQAILATLWGERNYARLITRWPGMFWILQTIQSCFGVCHPGQIKANSNLFRGFWLAPTPLLSSVPAHPSSLCSVWALEVVSRGLCPVHWSWKKSVSCLVMEQDVPASQEWWEVFWVSWASGEQDRPLEATSSEEVKAAFVSLLSAACLVIIHSLNMSTNRAFQERSQLCRPWKSAQPTVTKD